MGNSQCTAELIHVNYTREKPIIIRKTSAAVSVVVTVMVISLVIDNFSFKIRGRYSQPGSLFCKCTFKKCQW